jgi:Mrp family chromosome partitioning ATPase
VLVNEQQLTEMNNQLNTARARTMEARARAEQIERLRRGGAETAAIPEAVQSQTIGLLRAQYAEAARQLADLSARVGPRHPSLATSEAQVRDLRRLISDEVARIAIATRSELERAQAGEQSLERSLEALKKEAITTRQASVRLRELEREVEASRAVYEAFLVRARETGEQQTVDTTNARVISSATPPRDKSWPPRILLVAIALALGLGSGTGAALLREYFDDKIRSGRHLNALTGVPVLATLPLLPPRIDGKSAATNLAHAFDDPHDRASRAFAAAIDRLRDGLHFDPPRRGRSLLVVSPNDGEGKTTIALHLARAAAARGERVLLVDADFDGRTASRMMKAETRSGLADLIEGRTILSAVVVNDSATGVHLLPAGNASRPQTSRPAASDLLQGLIEPALSFDLIVIDAASLLGGSQLRPFAEAVDNIVFVARAGATAEEDVSTALEGLRPNAHKIRGAVFNAAVE